MKLSLGIPQESLTRIGSHLNQLLADEFILYIKTLNFHWNLTGMQFHDLHAFFKELYEKQLDYADDVAERARTLGVHAFGSAQEFIKATQLKEVSGSAGLTAQQMIHALLEDHETVIRSIRTMAKAATDAGDDGTNNFLVDLMEKHEKTAWMLRVSIA